MINLIFRIPTKRIVTKERGCERKFGRSRGNKLQEALEAELQDGCLVDRKDFALCYWS